jgi:hypothetical protein
MFNLVDLLLKLILELDFVEGCKLLKDFFSLMVKWERERERERERNWLVFGKVLWVEFHNAWKVKKKKAKNRYDNFKLYQVWLWCNSRGKQDFKLNKALNSLMVDGSWCTQGP